MNLSGMHQPLTPTQRLASPMNNLNLQSGFEASFEDTSRLSMDSEASASDLQLFSSTAEDVFSWMLLNATNMPVQNNGDAELVGGPQMAYDQSMNDVESPLLSEGFAPQRPDSLGSLNVDISQMDTELQLEAPLNFTHRLVNNLDNSNSNQESNMISNLLPVSPSNSVETSPGSSPISSPYASDAVVSPSGKQRRRRRRRELTEEEKRKRIERRLEKNRESARVCRLKKNKHLHDLENRVNSLENENNNLKKQLQKNHDVEPEDGQEKQELTHKMAEIIKEGGKEQELHNLIDMYKARFMEKKNRQESLHYHLEQIEQLLIPTQIAKMGLWTVEHTNENNISDESDKKDSLWNLVMNELDLTEQQRHQIVHDRQKVKTIRSKLQEAIKLVQQMKIQLDAETVNLDSQMSNLMQILTPKQAAKFILLVQNNPSCMQMLNSVWKQSI